MLPPGGHILKPFYQVLVLVAAAVNHIIIGYVASGLGFLGPFFLCDHWKHFDVLQLLLYFVVFVLVADAFEEVGFLLG